MVRAMSTQPVQDSSELRGTVQTRRTEGKWRATYHSMFEVAGQAKDVTWIGWSHIILPSPGKIRTEDREGFLCCNYLYSSVVKLRSLALGSHAGWPHQSPWLDSSEKGETAVASFCDTGDLRPSDRVLFLHPGRK